MVWKALPELQSLQQRAQVTNGRCHGSEVSHFGEPLLNAVGTNDLVYSQPKIINGGLLADDMAQAIAECRVDVLAGVSPDFGAIFTRGCAQANCFWLQPAEFFPRLCQTLGRSPGEVFVTIVGGQDTPDLST